MFFVTPKHFPIAQYLLKKLQQSVTAAPMGFPQAQASVCLCLLVCSNSSLTEQLLCSVIRHLLAQTHATKSASYSPNIVRLLHILVFNSKLGG